MSCNFNSAVIIVLIDKSLIKESSRDLHQMSCTFNSAVIKVLHKHNDRE